MKNVTIAETARRLKEAGFPQPPFQVGQSWYDTSGELFWVKCDESPYIHGEWYGDDHSGFVEIPHGDEVFAPTATDILLILPGHDMGFYSVENEWTVFDTEMNNIASNENPAEAAALAWLAMNEKK